ncbi:MAG: LrgB family protein [Acidobacteriaceae bacterium]|nr:LrgB family protein [Acidobacteriaceae bacterium]
MRALTEVFNSPAFAIGMTLVLYWASLRVQKRYMWASPLVTASLALVLLLYVLRIPYADYRIGGNVFTYLLGPATVALGVPMYKQGIKLKGSLRRLLVVVLAGSIVGMFTAGIVAWLFGASHEVIMSTLPKSVTTPIAIQVSAELHGNPAITAAMVLVTGVLGSIVGPSVLRMSHIFHDNAHGAAIGTSSHAVGTASLLRTSEVQGSVSSLAMAMAGVITSILAMLLTWYWH